MKKILTLAAMVAGLAFGANAQKHIDLQLTALTPLTGDAFSNLAAGDSFYIYGIVKNLGTDAVEATDTIQFHAGGFASDNSQGYEIFNRWYGLTIASGASDTIGMLVKQGQNYGAGDNGNVTAKFPTNANDTIYAYVSGESVADGPYDDPGYDPNLGDDALDLDGNNFFVSAISFGSTGIKDAKISKGSLNVFPNPANNQISFTNNFATTTTASVRITDIAGRVVKTMDLGKQSAGTKTYNVDIAELNKGMYYIELVTESTRSINKFVKN